MNMFARFDEHPAMTLRVIKETKRYRRTDGRTDNVKTVYPLQTKFISNEFRSSFKMKKKSLLVTFSTIFFCRFTWQFGRQRCRKI